MSSFLRGKQAGIQKDFSSGLDPQLFAIDQVTRYGINSQVSCLAYDPVHSLLAVGTNDTKFGSGQVYVFGQGRVQVTLHLARKASVKTLHFCADKLICVDAKNDISIFDLGTARILATYAPPGMITAIASDPTLDFVIIGLQNGDIITYDLDRHGVAPLRIPNLWKERNPRARISQILSLAFHPRDIGSLLIGYADGAVLFSFQSNAATKYFHYQLPAGAPGGDLEPSRANAARAPRLTQALWHPTGTFILTAHEDSSFVLWDPTAKDGKKILARTLHANYVDQPGAASSVSRGSKGTFAIAEPIFRVAWCCKENPDDTGILIAGGTPRNDPEKGLTFLDLGPTPVYATSSYQILENHFARPKQQHILPTPPNAEVIDFCLIPRKSPYYAGACDPIAVIALLASGEIITMSFPSGHPITPSNQLHVSLNFVHPFVNRIDIGFVDRVQWLGMVENRSQGPKILKGGTAAKHSLMRYPRRNVIQTAHADGIIRLWDAGHGDGIENSGVLQVDVARAVGRYHDIDIVKSAISGATGELTVGLRTGEVVVFRWGKNRNFGREVPHTPAEAFGLETIIDRAEPSIKEGLLPLALLDRKYGSVTSLKVSDVGFVCAGFEDGHVTVIDLRGPAVIHDVNLSEFAGQTSRHRSVRGSSGQVHGRSEWAICSEFGVMDLEGENYSSILIFVGTSTGRVVTLKLLPDPQGGYGAQLAGTTSLEDAIISISPMNADTGEPADAAQSVVGSLRNGIRINGVLLVVTESGARIFKPAASKGAHKAWDQCICYSASVVRFEAHTYCLVGLFGDGSTKVYSIPALKEIASSRVDDIFDIRRFSESKVTPTGFIFGWTGPSEIAVLNVWGSGQDLSRSLDKLFNTEAEITARPTISNFQWISGTSYISPADLDKLIGGPDRPPSKRMIEQQRADEAVQRSLVRQGTDSSSSSSRPGAAARGKSQEGYWEYMQRQIQERTESLGLAGDNMDKVEENSQGFADDVGKYVSNAKKKAVMGLIGSKFGL